ncbi:unnamed protein product [Lactuca virosa]|uniref:Uncharacterized protein n=1 Tax=Lactuca virosa TaxID=75947 RepID=A0AAU9ML43_9ASTR|nr:unnamed protein product [Lactuca virosa]
MKVNTLQRKASEQQICVYSQRPLRDHWSCNLLPFPQDSTSLVGTLGEAVWKFGIYTIFERCFCCTSCLRCNTNGSLFYSIQHI